MQFFDNVICPISYIKIDNNVSRLTVFFNAIFIALFVFTGTPYFIVLVAIDYGIRVWWDTKYSPLRWIAAHVASLLRWSTSPTDQAPKLFAARVGFLFSTGSTLLLAVSPTASLIVAGVLLVFTLLDSVFDFCVGCLTYSYIVLPLYKWRGVR